jgi:hypothetical protein
MVRSVAKKHTDATEYVKLYNTAFSEVEMSFIIAKTETINPICPTEEYAINFLMLSWKKGMTAPIIIDIDDSISRNV